MSVTPTDPRSGQSSIQYKSADREALQIQQPALSMAQSTELFHPTAFEQLPLDTAPSASELLDYHYPRETYSNESTTDKMTSRESSPQIFTKDTHDDQLSKSPVDSVRTDLTQHPSELLEGRGNVPEGTIGEVSIEAEGEIFQFYVHSRYQKSP